MKIFMSAQVRPTGVTILAILEIVSGIMMGNEGVAVLGAISGITVVLGAMSFFMAWGLLKGKSWAWTITLILTIISLIFDLPSMNVIGIIIDIVILYYLFRPHVKAYFGKSAQVL